MQLSIVNVIIFKWLAQIVNYDASIRSNCQYGKFELSCMSSLALETGI